MNPEDTERQRDLATTYRKQGEAAAATGELDTARNAYEDSLRIATQLATSNPSNTEWQLDLSIIYVKLGDVMAAMAASDLARARRCYQIGRSIIAELAAADPRNLHWAAGNADDRSTYDISACAALSQPCREIRHVSG